MDQHFIYIALYKIFLIQMSRIKQEYYLALLFMQIICKSYILSYDIYMYMIPIHKLTFMENIFVTVNNYLIPSQLELLKLW